MGDILKDEDAKRLGSWLPKTDKKESNTIEIDNKISKKDLEKIEKLKKEINSDSKKLLDKLYKLYELKAEKETYDNLITVNMIQRN